MKLVNYPKVSIIIITYNVERTISSVLSTIENQDYPKTMLEVLAVDGNSTDNTLKILRNSKLNIKIIKSPYPKDPEACRGVGLKYAKGEVICFIDSDNFMPHKNWLTKMIKPLINHSEVVGTQTARFAYLRNDNYLNRYFALIGSADPVGLYLGKADKMPYISNKWGLYGNVIQKEKDYFLVKYTVDKFPTLGSNGFCARTKLLRKAKSDPEHYFHIDVPLDLAKMGYDTYAVVNDVIIHDTATTLRNFLKKRLGYMKLHYQKREKDRRYKVFDPSKKEDKLRIVLFVLLSITFIQPTYVAFKGYLALRDWAWFVHPIFCFCIMCIYSFAVIERLMKKYL